MDVIADQATVVSYRERPPVVVAASSAEAARRARMAIDHSGLRLGAEVSIDNALDRIDAQIRTGVVWIELDDDAGSPLDHLLHRLARDASDGRYPAIVSAPASLVDPVTAAIGDSPVDLLIDPSESERIAALALANSSDQRPMRVSDITADRSADQLRHLSDEVNRIATMLSRLSTVPGEPRPVVNAAAHGDAPDVSVETVRRAIRARRLRARYFDEALFADPAWDMLLDLLQAELSHLRVPVSSLCIAASVPATTALRWLKTMVGEGLFVRRADPHDGRRVFVELSPDASASMRRYFAELGSNAAFA